MARKGTPAPPLLQDEALTMARIALRDAWHRLRGAMEALSYCILQTDRDLDAYCAPQFTGIKAREEAARIYRHLKHHLDNEGTTTTHLPGILCASQETLQAAAAVNAAKLEVRKAIAAIPKRQQPAVLRKLGLARMHRKQVYRNIKVLGSYDEPEKPCPVAVGWAWTKKVANYETVDIAALRTDLMTSAGNDERAARDLDRLNLLERGHRLVYVKPGSVYLVNNVSYPPKSDNPNRNVVKANFNSMPMLVASRKLPRYNEFLSTKDDYERERPRRSDATLDEAPYLEMFDRIFREVPNRVMYREKAAARAPSPRPS